MNVTKRLTAGVMFALMAFGAPALAQDDVELDPFDETALIEDEEAGEGPETLVSEEDARTCCSFHPSAADEQDCCCP